MKKYLPFLLLLFATVAVASDTVFLNPTTNGDLVFKRKTSSSTAADVIRVDGTTGNTKFSGGLTDAAGTGAPNFPNGITTTITTGKVGIGSATPAAPLDVEASIPTGQGTTIRIGNTSTAQNFDIYGGSGNNSPSLNVRSNERHRTRKNQGRRQPLLW